MATPNPKETAIDPNSGHQFDILKNPTVKPDVDDHRGPLIYDRTLDASLNGEDPNYSKKEGV